MLAGVSLAQEKQAGSAAGATKMNGEPAKQLARGTKSSVPDVPEPQEHRVQSLVRDFIVDQKDLWTSPARVRMKDTSWLVPLSGLTAGLFVTDADVNRHLTQSPSSTSHYEKISTAAVGGLVGGAAGMWVLSHYNGNDHWNETGFLAGEAAVHSVIMTETLKYSLRRQRPFQGDGTGPFFQRGGTSFPSEHSAAAWSVAAILAHEYPGPLTKILAYGAASLVSYSRVRAEKHFPSDVLIGAVIGQLAARQVYTRHHDPELGGDTWDDPAHIFFEDGHPRPGFIGSPYVPLDSWVYPALDRLAAMGLVDSAFAGMRPWTRLECARLVSEARDRAEDSDGAPTGLMDQLEREFQPELEGGAGRGETTARLESLYFRGEQISGTPLRDGYHFAQTQINDFGRPYGQGWNSLTGFSAYTSWGPWVGYVRGELQTAPSVPAYPLSVRQFVAGVDGLPSVAPGTPTPALQQFQLLDAYAGLTLSNWQVTFGRQSLSWGPGEGGAMMFSDNIEPINMFRINRVSPIRLPSLLSFLGPMRVEGFIGQLDGHHFAITPSGVVGSWTQTLNPQPFIDGAKVNFKPTPNMEIGLSYGSIFAGVGIPATVDSFIDGLLDSGKDLPNGMSSSGRRTGLDFTYRIPKLRNWLTLYADGFAEDQVVFLPYGYPERAIWRSGIYVPKIPRLSNVDFRAEGVYTDNPIGGMYAEGYYYLAARYLNGYTNDGNIVGSWIGRQGQGVQTWTNYWFGARNRIQLNVRHQKVSPRFVPSGGTLTDVGVRGDFWLRPDVGISLSVQGEKWLFPVIQPNASTNVTGKIQVSFEPRNLFKRFAVN
jgi:membrane-associated phospholipid phosphatase